MLFKDYLKEKQIFIEKGIETYLEILNCPKVISEGMKYSVLNGGKRLRPILLLMTLEILNSKLEVGIPTAVAIEMIHSYSLVHDDLPALDNDDYRRGKLTTHKKFGEAEAILIGDALLTHAFTIISQKNKFLTPEQIVEIISITSDYAGASGMIGGQMVDIESENKKIDIETLKYIHSNKTGKLLKLPVECGVIIGKANLEEKRVLIDYAELIGLAFQIKDDILDIEGSFEEIGKPVGSDILLEKSTYPSIIGMEESKKLLNETLNKAKKLIFDFFGQDRGKYFLELADYIGVRNK